ncbi:VTT domain-containing protein [Arthrobacter sp. AZCC_0090]|uniref:DedA family protein n=1 Tax=Arthrobacter sp. AZCC_0090 TaxID=2735881 RepID=UPI001613F491|nr:VTT domain-containing protein [Arthrobacter sp. AZCC_0090]MBB6403193.1 membrane protein DedA with SNARE-associated domain [Arthrobacter sp. AZCC_0090]
MEQILDLPFEVALVSLFAVVMVRVNATYWIGRGAAAGWDRARLAGALHRPKAAKAQVLIQRFGPYAVVLTFLTIGLQTAVNLAAGAARMPLKRYLPAAMAGSAIWAFVYATIGLAAIEAWLAVMAASPLGAVLLVLALAGVAVFLVIWRRRRTPVAPEDTVV